MGIFTTADKTFFRTFLILIIALHAVVATVALASYLVGSHAPDPAGDRARLQALQERIAPIGHVIVSAEQLKMASPAPAAASAALSGEQVVQNVCSACHGTGLMNSPKAHDKAGWNARLQQAGSLDALVASAVRGKNQMPPKGGDQQLTDQQIREAIQVMMQ